MVIKFLCENIKIRKKCGKMKITQNEQFEKKEYCIFEIRSADGVRADRGQRAPFPCHLSRLMDNNSILTVPMSLKSNTTRKPAFARDQGV